MGNPHPTKSKPCVIGRKHTGAISLRQAGRLTSAAVKQHRLQQNLWRKYHASVAEYWRGERDTFPLKPQP